MDAQQGETAQTQTQSHADSAGCDVPQIIVKVEVHEKVGDGLNSYMTYKVTASSELSGFGGQTHERIRRFKDFEWVHEKLSTGYPYLIIPPLPEKHVTSTGKFSKEFIETRRKELEYFLKKITTHPGITNSPDLLMFLTASEEGWNTTKSQTNILSSKLGRAWTSGFISLVDSVMGAPKEPEPYFEEQKQSLTKMNKSLESIAKSSEKLGERQKELATALTDLGHGSRMLSSAEVDSPLSLVMSQFAAVAEKSSAVIVEQAKSEHQYMEEPASYYSKLASSGKTTLTNRQTLLSQLESANKSMQEKQDKVDKMKSAPKKDSKLPAAEKELADATAKSESVQADFSKASATIRGELRRFESERTAEMKECLIKYIEMQIEYESQLSRLWTDLAKEIRPKEAEQTQQSDTRQ